MGEQGGREEGEPEGEARAARAGPLGSLWGSSLAVLSHSFPTGNGMRLPATSGLEDCTRMGVGVLSVGPGEVGVCDCRVCAERPGRVDWRRVSAPRANCGVLRRRDKQLVFTDSLQSPERSRRPGVISSPAPSRSLWQRATCRSALGRPAATESVRSRRRHQPAPLYAPASICISLAVLHDEKVLECR